MTEEKKPAEPETKKATIPLPGPAPVPAVGAPSEAKPDSAKAEPGPNEGPK